MSALVKLHPGYRSSIGGLPDQSDQVQNAYQGDDTWTELTEDSRSCKFRSHPEHSLWAQAHSIFAPLVSAVVLWTSIRFWMPETHSCVCPASTLLDIFSSCCVSNWPVLSISPFCFSHGYRLSARVFLLSWFHRSGVLPALLDICTLKRSVAHYFQPVWLLSTLVPQVVSIWPMAFAAREHGFSVLIMTVGFTMESFWDFYKRSDWFRKLWRR